jgi:hypothetical protein
MIRHTGGWAGYRSVVMRVPEKRFGVAILSNAANLDVLDLAGRIADIYLPEVAEAGRPGREQKHEPVAKCDPTTWDVYAGTYRLGPAWWLAVSREGARLMTQATREAKFPMTWVSNATFHVPAYGSDIEFVREGSGPASHLLYRGIRAPRLNPPELSGSELATYAGDYWSEELRAAHRLEVRAGRLAFWHRSAGWVHLLPTGPDTFDTESGAALGFERDSASRVTGFRATGGRVRKLRFVRVRLPGPEFEPKP